MWQYMSDFAMTIYDNEWWLWGVTAEVARYCIQVNWYSQCHAKQKLAMSAAFLRKGEDIIDCQDRSESKGNEPPRQACTATAWTVALAQWIIWSQDVQICFAYTSFCMFLLPCPGEFLLLSPSVSYCFDLNLNVARCWTTRLGNSKERWWTVYGAG